MCRVKRGGASLVGVGVSGDLMIEWVFVSVLLVYIL